MYTDIRIYLYLSRAAIGRKVKEGRKEIEGRKEGRKTKEGK
jgi:hypothetical protein